MTIRCISILLLNLQLGTLEAGTDSLFSNQSSSAESLEYRHNKQLHHKQFERDGIDFDFPIDFMDDYSDLDVQETIPYRRGLKKQQNAKSKQNLKNKNIRLDKAVNGSKTVKIKQRVKNKKTRVNNASNELKKLRIKQNLKNKQIRINKANNELKKLRFKQNIKNKKTRVDNANHKSKTIKNKQKAKSKRTKVLHTPKNKYEMKKKIAVKDTKKNSRLIHSESVSDYGGSRGGNSRFDYHDSGSGSDDGGSRDDSSGSGRHVDGSGSGGESDEKSYTEEPETYEQSTDAPDISNSNDKSDVIKPDEIYSDYDGNSEHQTLEDQDSNESAGAETEDSRSDDVSPLAPEYQWQGVKTGLEQWTRAGTKAKSGRSGLLRGSTLIGGQYKDDVFGVVGLRI